MTLIDKRQLGRIDFDMIENIKRETLVAVIGAANDLVGGILSPEDKQKIDNILLDETGQVLLQYLDANKIVENPDRMFVTEQEKTTLTRISENDLTYIHDQIASSKEWTINHTLGKYPSVAIVDTGGNVVIGDIQYMGIDQVIVRFQSEFSGKAYLN